MNKKVLKILIYTGIILFNSCKSDNDLDNGISIDPNNISLETVNGTWEATHIVTDNNKIIDSKDGKDVYNSYRCPEKATSKLTSFEEIIGIENNRFYSKFYHKKETYIYDNSTKDEEGF